MKEYEEFIIYLTTKEAKNRQELHHFLKERGYKSEDDFYYLSRKDKPTDWQGEDVLDIDILMDGTEIYETEEDIKEGLSTFWNELRLGYLLASLPENIVFEFLAEVESLVKKFDLEIQYKENLINISELQKIIVETINEANNKGLIVGSKEMSIAISKLYPSPYS